MSSADNYGSRYKYLSKDLKDGCGLSVALATDGTNTTATGGRNTMKTDGKMQQKEYTGMVWKRCFCANGLMILKT